jgi:hypothetical protein
VQQSDRIECSASVVVRGVAIPLAEANHERALYSFVSGNHPAFRVWYWPLHSGAEWFVSVGVVRGKMTVSYALGGANIHEVCNALCAGMPSSDWSSLGAFLRECVDEQARIVRLARDEEAEAAQ